MKKLVNILISAAIIISLSACCHTAEENPEPGEAESMEIGGARCITSAENPTAMGMFYEDGSLSVAWVSEKFCARYVYSTLVPAALVSELPVTENGIVELQYIIDNAGALELDVTLLDVTLLMVDR